MNAFEKQRAAGLAALKETANATAKAIALRPEPAFVAAALGMLVESAYAVGFTGGALSAVYVDANEVPA